MERAIGQGCDFITTDSIAQVHDYKDTSMFSMSAVTRRASKSTIQIFADYYPELLAAKFFVNVPRVLAWVFGAISNFLSKETVAKFVVLCDARDLSQYIDLDELPERYGGHAKLVSRPATANPQEGNNAVSEVTAKVEGIDLNKVDGNPTVV
jgi:phosphatidylinositol transfer protein SFH5